MAWNVTQDKDDIGIGDGFVPFHSATNGTLIPFQPNGIPRDPSLPTARERNRKTSRERTIARREGTSSAIPSTHLQNAERAISRASIPNARAKKSGELRARNVLLVPDPSSLSLTRVRSTLPTTGKTLPWVPTTDRPDGKERPPGGLDGSGGWERSLSNPRGIKKKSKNKKHGWFLGSTGRGRNVRGEPLFPNFIHHPMQRQENWIDSLLFGTWLENVFIPKGVSRWNDFLEPTWYDA